MQRLQSINQQTSEHKDGIILDFQNKVSHMEHRSTMMLVQKDQLVKKSDWKKLNLSDYFSQYEEMCEIYQFEDTVAPCEKIYPRNGFFIMSLPFQSHELLRNRFAEIDNKHIRVGKLLELMDYCAWISCVLIIEKFQEKSHNTPQSFVTASMDNVKFFGDIPLKQDMMIQSYPTWNGNSSLEIRIDVICNNGQKDQLYGCAFFIMVFKNNQQQQILQIQELNSPDKKIQDQPNLNKFILPGFSFEGESDQQKSILRFEIGKFHSRERAKKLKESVYKETPTQQESQHLHKLFLNYESLNEVKMSKTKIQKYGLLQFQKMNKYGKVFGGIVLRESYDLAYTACYLYSNQLASLHNLDDVNFFKGVSAGSVLKYEAYIVYVEKHLVHVKVTISVKTPLKKQEIICYGVHLTLFCDTPVPNVYPHTYEETLDYLEGKRRVEKLLYNQ